MRFLVDESTGAAVADHLRRAGHDVSVVAELMAAAEDGAILARASAEGRIVVTNDKDFGTLVYRSGLPHHGVVLLRLHDERPANRVRVIAALLEGYADRLADHFVVVSEGGVRVRPLKLPFDRL